MRLRRLLPFFALLAVGCSPNIDVGYKTGVVTDYTSCFLPSLQGRGSLKGQWTSLPVQLVFDNDFYTTDGGELMPSLRSAVQSWNLWGGIRGFQVFRINNDTSSVSAGHTIPSVSSCNQSDYTVSMTTMVGIWKITSTGDHRNVRDTCTADSTGVGKILPIGVQGQTDWTTYNGYITGASILLNFEGYNAPGKQHVDVESLLLHELGHVLGLLHSCNASSDGSDKTSAPSCWTSPIQYTDAVMYPYLDVNQVRRQLQQNDYNRVNCLY